MALLASPWALVALFVLLAYTTEAITGFGSIVIALSLSALVLPLSVLMPVLVPLSLIISVSMTWRYRRRVQWRLLFTHILPLMGTGTLLGYLARPELDQALLKTVFGVVVVGFSGRELWRLYRGIAAARHGEWWTRGWILAAGVTHGLFASGGPLLVYALSGIALDKTRFRATLIAVWLMLNGLLTLAYAADGSLPAQWPHLAVLAPVVVVGMLFGDWLHHRVDEQRFRQMLFAVLLLAGLALIVRGG